MEKLLAFADCDFVEVNIVSEDDLPITQVFPIDHDGQVSEVIDHYMQDCIRYIATDSRNKYRFDYRYDHMKLMGLITLVNEWYSYNVRPSEHSVR